MYVFAAATGNSPHVLCCSYGCLTAALLASAIQQPNTETRAKSLQPGSTSINAGVPYQVHLNQYPASAMAYVAMLAVWVSWER